MTLDHVALGHAVTVTRVGGEGGFRRRLMELGLLPGTMVVLERVAPLGDPLELCVRGARLSIRRNEAREIQVLEPVVGGVTVPLAPVVVGSGALR